MGLSCCSVSVTIAQPDVLVIPPDPPQLMIKVDQVRRVIDTIYFRPAEAKERIYIFTDSAFMKEAANSLLKVLEEPPEFATIFLLTENPGELLPTIRSRAQVIRFQPKDQTMVEEAARRLAAGTDPGILPARFLIGAARFAGKDDPAFHTLRQRAWRQLERARMRMMKARRFLGY